MVIDVDTTEQGAFSVLGVSVDLIKEGYETSYGT